MLYFIVNETSQTGKGQAVWPRVRAILDEQVLPYKAVKTKYKGHATELAAEISRKAEESGHEETLVVLGGDGTLNEVVNGITDFEKIRLGVIPNGSGNDFGRGTGLPGKPEEAMQQILNSNGEERMDLGRVSYPDGEGTGSRYFTISSGLGMDAIVCKKALTSKLKKVLNRLHLGKLTYLMITVQTLFSMTTGEAEVSGGSSEEKSFRKLIFAAAMNLRAEGGGVPMAPQASPTDGKLSYCFAHGIPKGLTFFVLPFLVLAKHEKLSCFHVEDDEERRIELSVPMTLHADGEYLGEVKWAQYTCLPGALRLIK